MICQIKNIPI